MIKAIIFLLIGIFYVKCFNTNMTNMLFNQISNPNKVILGGHVDKLVISRLIYQIDLMTKSNPDKNIFILIDSIGGDLIEGIKFINWMEKNKLEKI